MPRTILAVIPLFILALHLIRLRQRELSDPEWLPIWILVPMLGGFAVHFVVKVAESSQAFASTPGWYLHTLVVPLGMLLASVLRDYWQRFWFRCLGTGFAAYALLFSGVVAWKQILLFTGYIGRAPDRALYTSLGLSPSPNDIFDVLGRLELLAFPWWGSALFLAATASLVIALGLCFVSVRRLPVR